MDKRPAKMYSEPRLTDLSEHMSVDEMIQCEVWKTHSKGEKTKILKDAPGKVMIRFNGLQWRVATWSNR